MTRTRMPATPMRTTRVLAPTMTAVAAATIAILALVLVSSGRDRSSDPPPMAALSSDDRQALSSVPVHRGAPAEPLDAAVDLRDPEAVARAYLVAAHSISSADTGRTQLRAAGYAVPGSPPAAVGVIVLDAPRDGSTATAIVTALELVAADRDDRRRGYRAELGIATGPPGAAPAVALVARDVVLARESDGRWLVAADTTASIDLIAGEG
jgi:hypothetical protein